MANIDTGSHRGRRVVDSDVPLVPFIDLLLCCVMFLLVTAVWNQLGALRAATPGGPTDTDATDPERDAQSLVLVIEATGYQLTDQGGVRQSLPKHGDDYDVTGLAARLGERQAQDSNLGLVIVPDDGIEYRHVVTALDTSRGRGIDRVAIAATAP